jgi:hypothetical protein
VALSLLDGTVATIDFSRATNSYKCQLSSVAIEFARQLFTRITFCSTNWITNNNGMKSARWVATGYPGKSTVASKPGAYFLTDSYPAMLFTVDTGCTIGFTTAISRETLGMIAASNGSYSLEGENKNDDLAVTWVTT